MSHTLAACLFVLLQFAPPVIQRDPTRVASAEHYDAAAARAGFTAWGRVDDNRARPHAMVFLDHNRVMITIAVDGSVQGDAAERLGGTIARDLGWHAATLQITTRERSTYIAIQSLRAVTPGLPGQSQALLTLPVLRRTLDRITKKPVPFALRTARHGLLEAPPPAARTSDERSHFLFYMLDEESSRSVLRVRYGLATRTVAAAGLVVLLWLLVPLGWAVLFRRCRQGGARLYWAVGAGLMGLLLLLTWRALPPMVEAVLPPDWSVPLWGLWLLPVLLPLYLLVIGWRLAGTAGEPTPERRASDARAVVVGAAAAAVILGIPALGLLWNTHRLAVVGLLGLPVLAAVAYELSARAALPAPDRVPEKRAWLDVLTRLCLGVSILAVTLFAAFTFITMKIPALDLGWQIKTAEVAMTGSSAGAADVFSWTSRGQPWLNQVWLPNLFFYWASTRWPDWTLVLYRVVVGLLVLALVAGRTYGRTGRPWVALGAALLCAMALRPFVDIRPVVCSFALVAALVWMLDVYRRGGARWLPWVLPPMFLLWANTHSGIINGFIILTLWLVGSFAGRVFLREETPPLRPLVLAAVASAVLATLNVNGVRMLTAVLDVLYQSPTAGTIIGEWTSPDFHVGLFRPFELLLLAGLGGYAAIRKRRLADILVLVAVAHAALVSVRMAPFLSILAAPLAAEALCDLTARFRERLSPSGLTARPRALAAVAAAAGLVVACWLARPTLPLSGWFRNAAALDTLPEEGVRRLAAGEWPGRLFNDYNWGGYLVWKAYPSRPVFVDGRAEPFYATGAFDDAMVISSATGDWRRRLERWDVETVLTARHGQLDRALGRDKQLWRLVHTGKNEVVYVRTGPWKENDHAEHTHASR